MLRTVVDSLISVIYPQECRICGGSVGSHAFGVSCRACWLQVRVFTGGECLCEKCGAYLGDRRIHGTANCRKCGDHHYDRAFAVGVYEGALAAAVIRLKNRPHTPMHVRRLIENAVDIAGVAVPDVIIPVPLSRKRLHERGHNQAEVIASAIARRLHAPVRTNVLRRIADTPVHRIAMDAAAREATVRDAFDVERRRLIENARIMLVDDVLTSGATTSNCAKVLKKNGAARVDVMTLARAVSFS